MKQIDQQGKEEALERGYRAAVAAAALPGVRYEAFDFHTECRGMRYHRLQVLIDRIAHEQVTIQQTLLLVLFTLCGVSTIKLILELQQTIYSIIK